MLRLYYTTTRGENEPQVKFFNSLGGYKSSSLFKNDQFDNLFSEISNYTLSTDRGDEYIGLIMINEGGTTISNIEFYFAYPENVYSKMMIAVNDLLTDSDGGKYMENIANVNSSPAYAEFHEADGSDNSVSIGDLTAGESIGIWFKRELLRDVITADLATIVEQDPVNSNRYVEVERGTSDSIGMIFTHD